jgi:carbon storage regulator CsrA
MLVLSRQVQEAVVVGATDGSQPSLTVTVLKIKRGSVRLGFVAADGIPIHRLDVWEKSHRGHLPCSPNRGQLSPVVSRDIAT